MHELNKQLNNSTFIIVLVIFVTNISFAVLAHDTKVTHPVITLEAIRLLEKQDKVKGEFTELYRMTNDADILAKGEFPLFWGAWNTTSDSTWLETAVNKRIYPKMAAANKDETEGFWHDLVTTPYAALHEINDMTVISGVVREDHPLKKVLNHFYHAYSTVPLTIFGIELGVNSKTRALSFLVRSANQYGYEIGYDVSADNWEDDWYDIDETLKNNIRSASANPKKVYFAKQLAFQTFGEALHHVEDMSSIAHVQNDGHLVFSKDELDDYEGHYLPNKIFQFYGAGPDDAPTTTNNNWFLNAGTVAATVDTVNDIWPTKQSTIKWQSNSLAHKIYNASVFQGILQPDGINSPASDEIKAGGELAAMFQYQGEDEDGMTTNEGLYHDNRSFFQFAVWTIEGVGNYHYKTFWWSNNDWWPTEKFDGPAGYYYIEQKSGDSFRGDESDFVVAHNGIRAELTQKYNTDTNGLEKGAVKNIKNKLLTKFAQQLVPLAIRYSAGFSAYWYNTVNSPPYLKAVKVKQKVIKVKQGDDTLTDYEFTAYDARWKNGHAFLTNTQDFIDTSVGYVSQALFTAKRKLSRETPTSPLYYNQDIDIYLTFSEPIKSPNEEDSNFEIGLKLESALRNGEISESASIKKLNTAGLEFIDLDDSSNATNLKVLAAREDFPAFDATNMHLKGSRWLVTIKKAAIESIEGLDLEHLYGAVRLVVKANDKNLHSSIGGAELDDKPRTPARIKATLLGDAEPQFAWYNGEIELDGIFSASKEENGNPITKKHFKYDTGKGDQNHILWFSPKVTQEDLTEQIEKNKGQGYDGVSITGMPKEDKKL